MSSPKLMLKIWMETSNHNNLTELKEEDFSEETIETESKIKKKNYILYLYKN
jgi:hypothetical protein